MNRAVFTLGILCVTFHHSSLAPANEGVPVDKAVQGCNDLAYTIFPQLGDRGGANTVFSPLGLYTSLAMVSQGARGETRSQIARTLRFSSDEPLGSGLAGLLRTLRHERSNGQLVAVQSLWSQQEFGLDEKFVRELKEHYSATAHTIDFKSSWAAQNDINAWARNKTDGQIPELITPDLIDAQTRLLLANAIHFHGRWLKPFDRERTKEMPFHLANGKSVSVPMMVNTDSFSYVEADGVQVLELQYANSSLVMLLLLPGEAVALEQLQKTLTPDRVCDWRAKAKEAQMIVMLPRFHFPSSHQLARPLQSLGLKLPFSAQADFTGITRLEQLYLSEVVQKVVIDVNEEGTEAAAASASILKTRTLPPVFRADRPFLFAILDRETSVVAFLGRVTNPSR